MFTIQIERLRLFFSERGLEFLLAFLLLLVGIIISRIIKRWLRPVLNRSRIREDTLLREFFLRSASLVVHIIAILAALGTIGFDVRAFLAGLGITGLILGFGLRDILANYASGLLLLIYRPFRAGELVEIEGSQGRVEELTIVNMQMTTTDGVRVIMPNSKVWGSKIINYSLSEHRQLEIQLKVAEEKTDSAIAAIRIALETDNRILKAPSTSIRVASITDKASNLTILAWTLPNDFQSVKENIFIIIQGALKKNHISIL